MDIFYEVRLYNETVCDPGYFWYFDDAKEALDFARLLRRKDMAYEEDVTVTVCEGKGE